MCSIGEEDFGDDGGAHTMMPDPKLAAEIIITGGTTTTTNNTTESTISNEICKRCNQNNITVKLNLKDAQCESCFYQYVRHKMRAEMGSTKIIKRGANVLLVFDGTIEAYVMFDMVRHAIALEQFKRLTIRPCAIYVDNTCISDWFSIEQRVHMIGGTLKALQTFGFEIYYASIAGNVPIKKFQQSIEIDNEQLMMEADFLRKFNEIGNQTAKEDYRIRLNLNRYRNIATQIGCMYVFLPSISHRIATDLLVNVALGRGKSVANDISFCDNRSNCEVKIIRPMRTITSLEIETYIRLDDALEKLIRNDRQLNDEIIEKSEQSPSPAPTSIHSLTKQFIDNLQENFASTVSTVFRTGDKISAAAAAAVAAANADGKKHRPQRLDNDDDDNGYLAKSKPMCKFCLSELDYEHSNTLLAIEYSRCVSINADRNEVNDVNAMMKLAENQVLGNIDEDAKSLMKSLCHACRNIFRNLNEPHSYI